MTDNEIIDAILKSEGVDFTNDPDDRGGPTKFGVTQATLSRWLGRAASIADVQSLDIDTARKIYARKYMDDTGYRAITNPALRFLITDSGVQHGPRRASRWIQQAVGANDDGVFGPMSRAAVASFPADVAYREVLATRCRFYGRIIARDRSQAKYALGWARRLAAFIEIDPLA